jgi:hypothetical protein
VVSLTPVRKTPARLRFCLSAATLSAVSMPLTALPFLLRPVYAYAGIA